MNAPLADTRRCLIDRELADVNGWVVWTETTTPSGADLLIRVNTRLEAAVARARAGFPVCVGAAPAISA